MKQRTEPEGVGNKDLWEDPGWEGKRDTAQKGHGLWWL